MRRVNLFFAGVPCSGKSLVGAWLERKHGYLHIDAEENDLDGLNLHEPWDRMLATGEPTIFLQAIYRKFRQKPIIVDWGFPVRQLSIVRALQSKGFHAWWFKADAELARIAFLKRGGKDPNDFDKQIADIEREWSSISSVFAPSFVQGLYPDGSQRPPEEIWRDMF